MIVKVQRPIEKPEDPWLVYDRTRQLMQFIPGYRFPVAVTSAMGDDFKAYFEVLSTPAGYIRWGGRVEEQNW